MYIQDLPANQEQPEPRYFFPLLLAVGQVDGSSKTICILGGEEGMTAPGEEHTAVHPQPTALVCPPHTPTWSWIGANRSWDRPATEAAQVPGHSPAPRLCHTHPPVCTAAVVQSPDVEATQVPSNRQLV